MTHSEAPGGTARPPDAEAWSEAKRRTNAFRCTWETSIEPGIGTVVTLTIVSPYPRHAVEALPADATGRRAKLNAIAFCRSFLRAVGR